MATANMTANAPAHVPPALVVDVSIYNLPGADIDPQLAWKALDQPGGPGLVWSTANGGHWITTRGELILGVLGDLERFSAQEISVPTGSSIYPMIPNQSDEPEHSHYRRTILPFLLPKAVNALQGAVRSLAVELIEGFAARGHCEFISEFSKYLPMRIFLSLVDLPADDREWLLLRADTMVRSGVVQDRLQAQRDMIGYLQKWIDARRAQPGKDLLSAIVHGKVGDRPMTAEEIMGESLDVMFGGLDTVASMMGFIMKYLATHPAQYQALVADPSSIPAAVEELLRRHGVAAVGRRVLVDMELNGVRLAAGDMVINPTCLHGLDEAIWRDPTTVDFNRPHPTGHGTFGIGVHKCPGERLARSEIVIMIEEWTRRIPVLRLAPGNVSIGMSGAVNGMSRLDLEWSVS
jgi:cytochrome P450